MKAILVLTLGLLLSGEALAQCRGGRCGVIQYQHQYQEGDWYYVGYYPNGYYVIFQNGQWVDQRTVQQQKQEPEPTPSEASKEKPAPREEKEPNFGIDKDKLTGSEADSYRYCGQEISKEEAHKIVGDKKLTDDSNKLRVTIIADDGTQKRVIADINSLIKDINEWAIVRGYPPNHWCLEPGFVTMGNPTVYCQAPGGKVLHRQDDYDGGGEDLAGALRKAKSSYDAKKDPDLRKPVFPLGGESRFLPYAVAAFSGAGVMHLYKRRKQ